MSAQPIRPDAAPEEKTQKRSLIALPTRGGGKTSPMVSFTASPRANLLPPEIGQREKARGVRRGLRLIVVLVLLVVAVGVGGAWYLAFNAQLELDAANQQTASLLAQKQQYAEVQAVQQQIVVGDAGVQVGGSTDIDWKNYFRDLENKLPSGVTFVSTRVDSQTPILYYPQGTTPLAGARIAELSFEAETKDLPKIPDWLNRLTSMDGFVDATASKVELSDGVYKVSITMHIDADAYSHRFDAVDPDAGTTTDTTTDTEAGQ